MPPTRMCWRPPGIADADMIIAVTYSDEVNMVACQIAHSLFDVPTKIARVRHQSYLEPRWASLFSREHMPIDVIISPEIEVGARHHAAARGARRLRHDSHGRRQGACRRRALHRRYADRQHAAAPAHRAFSRPQHHRHRHRARRQGPRALGGRPSAARRRGLFRRRYGACQPRDDDLRPRGESRAPHRHSGRRQHRPLPGARDRPASRGLGQGDRIRQGQGGAGRVRTAPYGRAARRCARSGNPRRGQRVVGRSGGRRHQ